ncbi:MAG: hypothetical protein GYA59_07265 [Chloroflexi bacterium]|nr:hypothetical protein [Chloroflexota bacterium]
MDVSALASDVHSFILRYGIVANTAIKYIQAESEGIPAKGIAESGLDASLMGLEFPNHVLDREDPILVATFKGIEEKLLRQGGGVYRYLGDVYYGGGEWILLTAWLGLHSPNERIRESGLWQVQHLDGVAASQAELDLVARLLDRQHTTG